MVRFPGLLTPAAALLVVLLVALPSGALSFERRSEGSCGGQAPLVLACSAKPLTLVGGLTVDTDAQIVCTAFGGACDDGLVQVDMDVAGPTGHIHGTCWFGETSNTCGPLVVSGSFYAGQDVQVTGSASLYCQVVPCSASVAVADWTVAVYT
jgi:hypothetical protein